MARATFVKAAAKDYPEHGIKKGEPYYWWKFRHDRDRISKTPPRPSQLTQSEYLGRVYGIQERIEDATADDSLRDLAEELADELRELAVKNGEEFAACPDCETDEYLMDITEGR